MFDSSLLLYNGWKGILLEQWNNFTVWKNISIEVWKSSKGHLFISNQSFTHFSLDAHSEIWILIWFYVIYYINKQLNQLNEKSNVMHVNYYSFIPSSQLCLNHCVNDDDKRSHYEGANLLLVATCKMDGRGILSRFAFIF